MKVVLQIINSNGRVNSVGSTSCKLLSQEEERSSYWHGEVVIGGICPR
jgi:hypothetical protein